MRYLIYDSKKERDERNEEAVRQKGWYEGTTIKLWNEIDLEEGVHALEVGDGDGLLSQEELDSRVEVLK